MRTAKDLLIATKAFTSETVWLSWWHLLSSLVLCILACAVACTGSPLLLRLASSITCGLMLVRLFIIYHDFQHGAILKRSWLADVILRVYGLLVLSPSSVWKHSHDHHHKHNSSASGANPGSFPLMTRKEYRSSSRFKRALYAISRHPITIASGYLTVFLYGMSIRSFVLNPRKHMDAGIAVLLHVALLAACFVAGWQVLVLGMLLPLFVACGLGSYLFYAQHNFPTCELNHHDKWHYVTAALKSSSYIRMNRIMHWFTGNVGFHHVHHLNAKIPFYRLPEAMAAIEELQSPGTTSLHPRDIVACFRLKLWDDERARFISFREAVR